MNWQATTVIGVGFVVIIVGTLYMLSVRQAECVQRGGHPKPVGNFFLCLTPDGRVLE